MKIEQHDVIVLGSGPAGGGVARMCHEAGLDVVIVEEDGWGGVCPLRGCEPKKILVDAAHTVSRSRDITGQGLTGSVSINWQELMRYKRAMTDPISDAVKQSLGKSGVKTVSGQARFVGDGQVEVAGHETLFEGKHVVIAVGARPRPLDVVGAELLLTSRQFLELDEMPESVVFIGGGFISFEFACVAAAAGSDVTIVHRSDRVLKGFDLDLSRSLTEAVEDQGVTVHLDRPVLGVERTKSGISVRTRSEDGEEQFAAQMGIVGAGRIPNTDKLNLEAAGVEFSSHGVVVNDFMQSVSNPRIFAAGDCAEAGMPLTPLAALQARTVARNVIDGLSAKSDLRGAASAVFTHPPLMRVGMLEEEAEGRGIDVIIHSGDAASWPEHKRLGLEHAGYKILEERSSGRIIGAHYLGQHAEEVANIFGLAIRHGLTRDDLMAQPWAYPSFGYALRYMFS